MLPTPGSALRRNCYSSVTTHFTNERSGRSTPCQRNSSNDETENANLRRACIEGKIKLLYISPEKLITEVDYLLRDMNLSLFAIDEAHCISQWGHDFRPEYAQMGILHQMFPQVATADKITRGDIIRQLHLTDPKIFISSFDRPNLSLTVKRGYQQKEKSKAILEFIDRHADESGIIYCMSRSKTETVAQMLQKHGIRCGVSRRAFSIPTRQYTRRFYQRPHPGSMCHNRFWHGH